jgi:hypothetical protein
MKHLGPRAPTSYSVAPRRGELGGNRTHDPRIKSALLYRLSYELNFYLDSKVPQWNSRYVRELSCSGIRYCGLSLHRPWVH